MKITVIDYGLNNINSIVRALKHSNVDVEVTNSKEKIKNAESIILPGVGAFGTAMKKLNELDLPDAIREYSLKERPLLGICLGMQLLMESSEEFGLHEGLGLIKGNVVKISNETINGDRRKVPHIGWADLIVKQENINNKLINNQLQNHAMYFVHSYMCCPSNNAEILAHVDYKGINITSIINAGSISGVQFHPEKSGTSGLKLLGNYIDL